MVEASDIDSVLGSNLNEDQRVPDSPLSKYSVMFALQPDCRDRADRLLHTPLVNVKHELFGPLVIVGSQIFERPSDGHYGGRWISD